MALIIESFLICDGNCNTNYGVDSRSLTGKRHRSLAKQEGWTYIGGKDYCPDCSSVRRKSFNVQIPNAKRSNNETEM